MAVLQMCRINICAWKSNRKAILERLQQLGVVEINIELEDDSGYEHMDTAAARASFEKRAGQAEAALEILDKYQPENKSFLASLEGKKCQSISRIREIEKTRKLRASARLSTSTERLENTGQKFSESRPRWRA